VSAEPIYLETDAGKLVTALTAKEVMKIPLWPPSIGRRWSLRSNNFLTAFSLSATR